MERPKISNVIQAWKPDPAYNRGSQKFSGEMSRYPEQDWSSLGPKTPRGLRAYNALAAMECEYSTELLAEIRDKQIAEDLVEFGIYRGCWINFLWQMTEQLELRRRIYGFDSFARLSERRRAATNQIGEGLVFDDWPHVSGFGEQRAFEEWLPTVANLEFEFLFYRPIGHFYLRVHHKK